MLKKLINEEQSKKDMILIGKENKRTKVNSILSPILNMNELNSPFERQRFSDWIFFKKARSNYMLSIVEILKIQYTSRLKVKG